MLNSSNSISLGSQTSISRTLDVFSLGGSGRFGGRKPKRNLHEYEKAYQRFERMRCATVGCSNGSRSNVVVTNFACGDAIGSVRRWNL
jgi:hypothetical protein